MSQDEKVRLSKLMSERGLSSRREADRLIELGLVKVDGVIVKELGSKVATNARIELLAEGQKILASKVTIVMNKPIGFVSSQPEDGYRSAMELIQSQNQSPGGHMKLERRHEIGLGPAGRLDIDSQGLMIYTQDGVLAKQIIGENSEVEKEYLVRVEGILKNSDLERLRHGLSLDGKKLKPAVVEWINEDQLRFVLREGRKRQIRRMCEAVRLKVTGLKRVRIGDLALGHLKEGHWRFLEPEEHAQLLNPTKIGASPPKPPTPRR